MPPPLALLLCTIFVLFLLRLESKQYPEASLPLWIPALWLMLNVSKSLGVWLETDGRMDMEAGSPLDRAFLSVLFFLGLLVLLKRRFRWTSTIEENTFVMMFLGYMLISIFWSDMLFISFKRWIRELILIVMVFVVLTEQDPRQAIQSIFRRIMYILLPFSLLLIKYYPLYGRQYHQWTGEEMWIGVCTQKNGLAKLCLFTLFYLVWTFIRKVQGREITVVWYQTYIEIFIFLLAIWLFLGPKHTLTNSATSAAALTVGLVALAGLLWLKKQNIIIGANTLTILIAAIIIYGTITPFVGKLTIYDPSTVLNRDGTLTGRADIWAYLVPYALQKPILGHGFGGFWTTTMRMATSAHAHNGYLDVVLNTGFAGLIFWSVFLISNCRKAQRLMTQDFDWGIFWFCFLLMAVVHNIAESSLISFTGLWPAILLLMLVTSPSAYPKQTKHETPPI